jgi:ABC-type multidrug transport system ATPase subunit
MSEQILKALMQLFAIIARPESSRSDRRIVVESFLRRLLNRELVEEYLNVFDHYYDTLQDKHKERGRRVISSSSVRVLKICTQINEELVLQQKIIVLYQLLEFVKSDADQISIQELEFIRTVADIFNIEKLQYTLLEKFVTCSVNEIPTSPDILMVTSKKKHIGDNKHIHREFIDGVLVVLNMSLANIFLVRYIGISELYLNGQLIHPNKVHVLTTGASIRNHILKPIYYSDIVSCFIEDRLNSRITFEVKNISHRFKNGNVGLHPMSFSEDSGKLVGIMGASGAGKSTLLNVLNGSVEPESGEVLINGLNIHRNKEELEGLIGHVSQDDLLIEELTVYQNLYYNAKLCFDNYSENRIIETVDKTLQNLGLYEIKDVQVGTPLNKKISGGQRKRLNIALELIREPSVLFLDEPTSGLSSRDSENILDLLKELALKGKLVFVVIHQPSSDIFKMFDKLLILDTGGYLIYSGDPIDSIIYFKEQIHHANWNESECRLCGNVNPEQIFNIVESNILDEFGQQTHTRKISPKEWAKSFKTYTLQKSEKQKSHKSSLPEISFKIPNRLKQFWIFVRRDILAKLSNRQYLIINFLEAPLLAFLLSFIIKYYDVSVTNKYGYTFEGNSNIPVYIFMSVIVAIFIGLSVSAEEIIKDRKILKREAFLNLSWSSYLLSKVAIMFVISGIQAFLFVIVGNSIVEIKGMYFEYWLVLFSAWATANIMGLVISDSFKTVVTIYILIPFLVIPQIILSGVIVKYEKLNPTISSPDHIPFYGEVITARWAYEALAVYQFTENDYQQSYYIYDKIMSRAEFKKNYWIPYLENKIDLIRKNIDKSDKPEEYSEYFNLVRNEIRNENASNPKLQFRGVYQLYPDKISLTSLEKLDKYIELLKTYYIRLYNRANERKDLEISDLQQTPEAKQIFLKRKRDYANEKLTEFVENKNEVVRIVEYEGNLYQKTDPIYLDPEHPVIRAHFYAPRKQVFGNFYHTYWVNIGVMWFMAFLLYLVLYFRLLKRALNYFDDMSASHSKGGASFRK